jgi:hypothetical protein
VTPGTDEDEKHFEVVPLRPPPRAKPKPMTKVKKPTAIYNGQAPPLEMQPCVLVELDDARCHWPLGEMHQVAVMFCGGAVEPGRRYCRHHWRRARGPAR